MPSALVLLNEGFETVEACFPIDILRRAKVVVTVASASNSLEVTSGQKLTVKCDALIDDVKDQEFDVIICPGGMPNAKLLGEHPVVIDLLKKQAGAKKWIAAICASPAHVLAKNGLLANAKAVGYPGEALDKMLGTSKLENADVHVDESAKIITARGPAHASEFGFTIANSLAPSSGDAARGPMLSP